MGFIVHTVSFDIQMRHKREGEEAEMQSTSNEFIKITIPFVLQTTSVDDHDHDN